MLFKGRIASFALFIIAATFSPIKLNGAHLVGGEITYTCSGSNSYEIKLRIYRDCNGNGAAFDQSVNFTIFDDQGNILFNPSVSKGATVQVPAATGNPCLTTPPNICTEYAEYIHTISLPARVGGYTISYQRCCRNATIANIVSSGKGNTYTIQIPSMDNCNSTPQFTTVPPIVLCKSDALNIDASAADANGDSLFYEFCDILNGGSSFNPSPNSADPPPYTAIPFISPQTSSTPIPGAPALSINPNTGFITGVANTTGQFVVGICVSEYENGILLSKVRRDYQFNITSCISNVVSDMLTQTEKPSLLCNGKIMTFQAQTSGALSYLWDFGDTTTTADTSSSPSPSYTYPDTGTYSVMLIINPGLVCTDTVFEVFKILDAPDYEIKYTGKSCFEAQNLLFYAQGGTPSDATFQWDFGSLSNTFGAQGDSVSNVSWSLPGEYPVRLIVSSSTCPDTVYDTISVVQWSVDVNAGVDTSVARYDTAYLSVSEGSLYRWFADKPVYFNNSKIKDPQSWQYQDSTTFYVIVANEYGCQGIDTVMIFWLPQQTVPDLSNVQNVITANMDGVNDVLDLSEVSFGESCTLRVLNRWGGQVYQQENYDDTWTGVDNNGKPLPPSTYYFLLQCDKELRYYGPITIIGRGL